MNHAQRVHLLCILGLSACLGAFSAGVERSERRSEPPVQQEPPNSPMTQASELDRLHEEGRQATVKGDFAAAERAFRAGLDKAQGLNDPTQTARFLNGLGIVYNHLGQFDRALDVHNQALTIREKLGNQEDIAISLTNLGNVYDSLGQFDKALDVHTRALAIREKLGGRQGIAKSLTGLGNVCYSLGQFDKALDCYSRALSIYKQLGNQQGIAKNLTGLGNVYERLGQFDKALDYHSRSLSIAEPLGNRPDTADSLINLGTVYSDLGQFDKALDCHTRALSLYEQLGSPQRIVYCLNNMGIAFHSLGQLDKALDCHTRALTRCEALGNQQDIAASLGNLGDLYSSLGQFARAQDCYSRALALCEQLGNQQEIAVSYTRLGLLCTNLGQFDKAVGWHTRALARFEPLGNQQDIARTLICLGTAYAHLNQLAKAHDAFDRAVHHLEAVSTQVGDPEQIGALQMTMPNLYANFAALLLQQKRPEDALAILERGRAQGLARQLAQVHADLARLLSPADAAQLKAATDACTAADRLANAANTRPDPNDPQARQALRRQREQARARCEQAERQLSVLRAQLYQRYPDFGRLQGAQTPSIAPLRALADHHPDTLYLEWAVVDDATTLLFALSHRDGLQTFTLPVGEKALTALAHRWRDALTAPAETRIERRAAALKLAATEPQQAQALFQRLLAPLQKTRLLHDGRFARLVIVADGPLLDLPFAALLDRAGKRLIERYALASSLSLATLTWPDNPRQPTASLLCAADPTGSLGERFAGGIQASALRGAERPLPQARQEARQLLRLFPDGLALIGAQAREAEVKQRMGQYALLHFATHGQLNAHQGLRSWLLLAPEPAGSPENGLLEARQIVGIPLAAQLATLSACESGRGQPSGGEGLLGLAWAFRAAGCGAVVGSQWRVEDAATQHLMVGFYRGLKAGQRKDAALRSAMLGVKGEAGHGAAFYWAGFGVIGDTRALHLQGQLGDGTPFGRPSGTTI